MTAEQVRAMTDAELVAAVAEIVMGWAIFKPNMNYNIAPLPIRILSGVAVAQQMPNGTNRLWCPLTNWNDTMMVVDAMRAKGWEFELCYRFRHVEFIDEAGMLRRQFFNLGNERRAILEAALLAIGGE